MKFSDVPFPAFYLPPPHSERLPSVTVRPCRVVAVFPAIQMATIEVHSLFPAGRVTIDAHFDDLASTAESAIKTATEKISKLPALDEKSATLQMAGASAGEGSR